MLFMLIYIVLHFVALYSVLCGEVSDIHWPHILCYVPYFGNGNIKKKAKSRGVSTLFLTTVYVILNKIATIDSY